MLGMNSEKVQNIAIPKSRSPAWLRNTQRI